MRVNLDMNLICSDGSSVSDCTLVRRTPTLVVWLSSNAGCVEASGWLPTVSLTTDTPLLGGMLSSGLLSAAANDSESPVAVLAAAASAFLLRFFFFALGTLSWSCASACQQRYAKESSRQCIFQHISNFVTVHMAAAGLHCQTLLLACCMPLLTTRTIMNLCILKIEIAV